jgi:hypothetical protein
MVKRINVLILMTAIHPDPKGSGILAYNFCNGRQERSLSGQDALAREDGLPRASVSPGIGTAAVSNHRSVSYGLVAIKM